MNNKKFFIILVFFLTLLCIQISPIHAGECDSCSLSECGKCGCVLSEDKTACVKVYSNYEPSSTSCGDGYITGIPKVVPKIVRIAYIVIQVAVPIVLVIFGMIDLIKGIYAQKEDEIKKSQQLLVKRLIHGIVIFFVFAVVKLLISFAADKTGNKIMDCADCFLHDTCG